LSNQGFLVLVVDDEPRVRQAVRRVLEQEGYRVEEAVNGQQGLESVRQEVPDLVLVDLMMPVMDGMEFLAAARRIHPGLASVVITGYATTDRAVEAMKLGADDFVAKPFKPAELRMVVERVLRRVRTLADIALEKSRTRALVEAMANGVMVADASGMVVMVNPSLARLLPSSMTEPGAEHYSDLIDCPHVRQAMEQVLAGRDEPKPAHCNCELGPLDDPVAMQVNILPFCDVRGNLMGVMAVFDDVTAWRKLDELKNEYISIVAHEIASPLSSVAGQIQVLRQGLAGPLTEKQDHLLNRAADRVSGIINLSKELLDLAKMEARARPEPEMVQVKPLLEEAVDMVSTGAREKEQSLNLEVDGELPPIQGVAREIQEVFINLASNAVKYTPHGGSVTITAAVESNQLVIRVADTGLGIAPEDQAKVFDKFYRVRNADTRQIVGTGLGLPIVKRVVEAHQGSIELQSELGKGSTFIVRLPLSV
jgi:signal transduction histidine kinase